MEKSTMVESEDDTNGEDWEKSNDFFFTTSHGWEALRRNTNSSWFKRKNEPGLIFWGWPKELQRNDKYSLPCASKSLA